MIGDIIGYSLTVVDIAVTGFFSYHVYKINKRKAEEEYIKQIIKSYLNK